MKNLDIKFEHWKKRKLYEGFLDGEEEKPVAAEDEAPAAETEESGDAGTDADMGGEDTSSEEAPSEEKAPEDTDVSEEGGEEELMKQQAVRLRTAQRNLDKAREKLNEAVADRKVHEKLKEKAFEEFKAELNNEEKKEIDQLVSFTYNDKGKDTD